MRVSSLVPPNTGSVSLVGYLAQRFTYLAEEEWRERIRDNRIFLNEIVCNDALVFLSRGDRVAYDLPDFEEPPADLNYRIVYDDEWILGVSKSGNLLVHKAGKSFRSNLIYQLRYCHQPSPYPHIDAVHRLDRETSGAVLFAKDKNIARIMNSAFDKRTIYKEYLALVRGIPAERIWTIRLPIGKDEAALARCKFRIDYYKGKLAETRFETIRTLSDNCAFLRIRPITGRTHQIRVHLEACGLMLIGDKLYGMSEINRIAQQSGRNDLDGDCPFPRHALHCASIGFEHPVTKKMTVVNAPLPLDMEDLLKKLGGVSSLSFAKDENETQKNAIA
jgi:RluA family pseudouridine synthase